MYNYYERTYYTLDDIRKAVNISPNEEGPYTMLASSLNNFIRTCLQSVGFIIRPGTTETPESEKCFKDYLWPRFYQEAIIYTDSDETEGFVEKFCRTKVGQIMS